MVYSRSEMEKIAEIIGKHEGLFIILLMRSDETHNIFW